MKKAFQYLVYFFALIGFVLTSGFFAIKYGITNEKGIIDEQRQAFLQENTIGKTLEKSSSTPSSSTFWASTPEWNVIQAALLKDKDDIIRAGNASGISPRLIASEVAVEQLRLFTTNRELFKTVFAPLKILGVQSQFSWGVAGIKQETAIAVENHLKDQSSPYYPGKEYEHLLDFSTNNHDEERFNRIIDEKSRYYSYLYAGLFIKEVEVAWKKGGYDIFNRPEILSTLYNIGFEHSTPNPYPKSGGAEIPVNGKTYSFGSLASEIYNSAELKEIFPK